MAQIGAGLAFEMRPGDVADDAEHHPIAVLVVVADLSADKSTIRCKADRISTDAGKSTSRLTMNTARAVTTDQPDVGPGPTRNRDNRRDGIAWCPRREVGGVGY